MMNSEHIYQRTSTQKAASHRKARLVPVDQDQRGGAIDTAEHTRVTAPHKTGFFHLSLHNLDTGEALDYCRSCFAQEGASTIFFVNAHCFNASKQDDDYLQALQHSDLVLNDGIGIKIASKLINVELKENMNGTDFIPRLLALAASEEKRVYLLGAKPGVADTARAKLTEQYQSLDICGTSSGYFSAEEEQEVIDRINASRAEIVVVGMGVPLQEKWIANNRDRFTHAKILVAGGAIIDFSAGRVKRAPRLFRTLGMEWLYRFMQEPKRLFRRYFVGNWKFIQHVLTARFISRRT
jgi:N-acetylglucosaminyldiphosphoundecaprenol N-acetyl-beta-D-mannosaminyltransferase